MCFRFRHICRSRCQLYRRTIWMTSEDRPPQGFPTAWHMLMQCRISIISQIALDFWGRRNLIFKLKRKIRRRDLLIMTLSYLRTSTTHTKLPDSNQKTDSRNHSCFLKSSATTLTVDPENEYLKFDASLQRYKCDVDPLISVMNILHHAIELITNFQSNEHPTPLIRTSFTAGRRTKIDMRVRDDTDMVQISTVVHKVERGEILSNKKHRKKSRYLLLMTMMRFNSLLSQIPFGGRICACNDGQFIFFQDLPVSILNKNGMLQNKLDDFIITTVEVRLGFDQSSGASNLPL